MNKQIALVTKPVFRLDTLQLPSGIVEDFYIRCDETSSVYSKLLSKIGDSEKVDVRSIAIENCGGDQRKVFIVTKDDTNFTLDNVQLIKRSVGGGAHNMRACLDFLRKTPFTEPDLRILQRKTIIFPNGKKVTTRDVTFDEDSRSAIKSKQGLLLLNNLNKDEYQCLVQELQMREGKPLILCIGSTQLEQDLQSLSPVLAKTRLLCLNEEEFFRKFLPKFGMNDQGVPKDLKKAIGEALSQSKDLQKYLVQGLNILLTCGDQGAYFINDDLTLTYEPVYDNQSLDTAVTNTCGCGDATAATFSYYLYDKGYPVEIALKMAMKMGATIFRTDDSNISGTQREFQETLRKRLATLDSLDYFRRAREHTQLSCRSGGSNSKNRHQRGQLVYKFIVENGYSIAYGAKDLLTKLDKLSVDEVVMYRNKAFYLCRLEGRLEGSGVKFQKYSKNGWESKPKTLPRDKFLAKFCKGNQHVQVISREKAGSLDRFGYSIQHTTEISLRPDQVAPR